MNHKGMRMSLVSRELIADSIEAVVRAHAYDALVGFAGCDKTLPGVMMAMVRLNCPSVFVYGGAMLPGRWRDADVTILTTYEGVGSVLAGTMTEAELDELGHACAPTLGSCPGQFTANTMAMVAETLGLAMPGIGDAARGLFRAAGAGAPRRPPGHRDRARRRPAAARAGDAQVARERLRRGRRHRRLDQRRPAPAGDRPRGRHPLHARRRRRGVRAHAADRRPAAGRTLPRRRPAPRRRRRRRPRRRCSTPATCTATRSRSRAARSPRSSPARPRPTARWCAAPTARLLATGGVVVLRATSRPTAR